MSNGIPFEAPQSTQNQLTTSDYGTATETDMIEIIINTSAPYSFPLDNTTITWSVIDGQ